MREKINIIGCGYIGQAVATNLIEQNYEVAGYVRSDESLEVCRVKNIAAHKIDFDHVTNEIPVEINNSRILYLVPPQPKGDKDERIEQFIKSLDGISVKKLVLLSTTGVYGNCHGDWVTEETPLNPQVDRAKRRADAEHRMSAFCKENNIQLVILRVAGIYGPNKLPLKRIKSGEPIVCEEDSPFSNRIHAVDLVGICCKALLSDDIVGVYNCADGNPTTMYDYFTKVAKAAQLAEPQSISLEDAQKQLSKGMLSYMAESRRIDNAKLLNEFAMQLKYPDLDSGLDFLTKE